MQHKLVHLDLKGAPPRIKYLINLIPILRRLGTTGLLIEYEDMFPYSGCLASIKASNHYTEAELQELFETCIANNLIVIPLIQCLGHMEFALKHVQFKDLREVAAYPNALCPSNERSAQLIQQMLEQVVTLHCKYMELQYVHLGGDEVWHMAVCATCRNRSAVAGWEGTHWLYLEHVTKLASLVVDTYQLTPILWDDMLRPMSTQLIIDSRLPQLIQPMIWHYADVANFQLASDEFWSRYTKLFPKLWLASAFKGASEIDQVLPPIQFHASNQLAWLTVQKRLQSLAGDCVQGIALTGWQRFDHFMTLCELLPVSIPCLAVCLQVLCKGRFDEEALRVASEVLRCSDLIPCKMVEEPFYADYPGAQLFIQVIRLMECRNEYQMLKLHPSFKGGFTKYARERKKTNPIHIGAFINSLKVLLSKHEDLYVNLELELKQIYHDETVEEWLEINISKRLSKLKKLVADADEQFTLNGFLPFCAINEKIE